MLLDPAVPSTTLLHGSVRPCPTTLLTTLSPCVPDVKLNFRCGKVVDFKKYLGGAGDAGQDYCLNSV